MYLIKPNIVHKKICGKVAFEAVGKDETGEEGGKRNA